MRNKGKLFQIIVFSISLLIFYVPVFLVILFSFNATKSSIWEGFSLKWVEVLFTNSDRLWGSFGMSMLVGMTSAITSTILGGIGAWGIWHHNKKMKQFLLSFSYIPLMLPDLIMGISLLILFISMAIPLGVGSILIAHTTMNIPFAVLLILGVLEDSDLSVIEAAKDLGANEFQIWYKVILPLIKPGIISSLLLTFTLSLDDFAITYFVSGPGSSTMPLYVYSSIRFGLSPAINVLSTLIIGISVILLSINKKHMKTMLK